MCSEIYLREDPHSVYIGCNGCQDHLSHINAYYVFAGIIKNLYFLCLMNIAGNNTDDLTKQVQRLYKADA